MCAGIVLQVFTSQMSAEAPSCSVATFLLNVLAALHCLLRSHA